MDRCSHLDDGDIENFFELPSSELDRPSEGGIFYDSDIDPEYRPFDDSPESENEQLLLNDTVLSADVIDSSEDSETSHDETDIEVSINQPNQQGSFDPGEGTSSHQDTSNNQSRGQDDDNIPDPGLFTSKSLSCSPSLGLLELLEENVDLPVCNLEDIIQDEPAAVYTIIKKHPRTAQILAEAGNYGEVIGCSVHHNELGMYSDEQLKFGRELALTEHFGYQAEMQVDPVPIEGDDAPDAHDLEPKDIEILDEPYPDQAAINDEHTTTTTTASVEESVAIPASEGNKTGITVSDGSMKGINLKAILESMEHHGYSGENFKPTATVFQRLRVRSEKCTVGLMRQFYQQVTYALEVLF
ncbi:hypothetical protein LSTR_LSTR000258 [Laodelphax striatellus]|uniref:Uncharacterized protein n=1 Tax=Laodelphax striatellus TaxID=195883 RepID=A0A482X6Y9_LAOST|nr:hypothetical protein LSTR_LSTR000258 [Laodelphax striatellus]